MTTRFLHISFSFWDGDNRVSQLKPIFKKALDWCRYAPNCWIVYTSSSAERWYERLRPFISDEDCLFIVEINLDERQGWLSRSTWDWLDKDRSKREKVG
ncbi:MAG: hypothetical protein WA459_02060 [Stellaceae bacterium]